jgi:hypothetical protein
MYKTAKKQHTTRVQAGSTKTRIETHMRGSLESLSFLRDY